MNNYINMFTLVCLIAGASGCKVETDTELELGENSLKALAGALGGAPAGQAGGTTGDSVSQPVSATEAALLDELATEIISRRYMVEGYTKVNSRPLPSQVLDGRNVEVFVDNENLVTYSAIVPEYSGSYLEVAQGTTIIQEIWTEDNRLENYALMIKMERGYFPEGGDFLYAVINLDGTLANAGMLEVCGTCHADRASDGFLFGVDGNYQ